MDQISRLCERDTKAAQAIRAQIDDDGAPLSSIYRSMYLATIGRMSHLIDHTYRHLMNADIHGLLEQLMEICESMDYVDETLLEWHQVALDRWPILEEIEERDWDD